jgi:hypothetical protein
MWVIKRVSDGWYYAGDLIGNVVDDHGFSASLKQAMRWTDAEKNEPPDLLPGEVWEEVSPPMQDRDSGERDYSNTGEDYHI